MFVCSGIQKLFIHFDSFTKYRIDKVCSVPLCPLFCVKARPEHACNIFIESELIVFFLNLFPKVPDGFKMWNSIILVGRSRGMTLMRSTTEFIFKTNRHRRQKRKRTNRQIFDHVSRFLTISFCVGLISVVFLANSVNGIDYGFVRTKGEHFPQNFDQEICALIANFYCEV